MLNSAVCQLGRAKLLRGRFGQTATSPVEAPQELRPPEYLACSNSALLTALSHSAFLDGHEVKLQVDLIGIEGQLTPRLITKSDRRGQRARRTLGLTSRSCIGGLIIEVEAQVLDDLDVDGRFPGERADFFWQLEVTIFNSGCHELPLLVSRDKVNCAVGKWLAIEGHGPGDSDSGRLLWPAANQTQTEASQSESNERAIVYGQPTLGVRHS